MSVCLSDCGSLFALKRDDGRQCENYSRLYIWLLKDRGTRRREASVWKSELKFSTSSAPKLGANETSCLMSLEDKGSARGNMGMCRDTQTEKSIRVYPSLIRSHGILIKY